MNGYLIINTQERSALMGLPYLQQVIYLLGIKPYMDRESSIVGIKRRISYQSLAEVAYIEPHQGIQSGSPSRDQLRRVIKALERAGLIEVQSDNKHLILKCLLAASDYFVQNKAATNTPSQTTLNSTGNPSVKISHSEDINKKATLEENEKAATPHNISNNCIVLLREQFEDFWSMYPESKNKAKAWDAFQRLNPDSALFKRMMTALSQQIKNYFSAKENGLWVPHWKYPENWISQECWNDELNTDSTMENSYGKNAKYSTKKSAVDILWESCKGGRDFDFASEEADSRNIIPFTASKLR